MGALDHCKAADKQAREVKAAPHYWGAGLPSLAVQKKCFCKASFGGPGSACHPFSRIPSPKSSVDGTLAGEASKLVHPGN
jgi:hypothetical protein